MAVVAASKALDLYHATHQVVGQESARKQMAALLERQWMVHQGMFERSSGAILGGKSGSGKSYTARLMCQHLGLPYAEVDATRYTESGYKGLDLQQMFIPLLEAAADQKDGQVGSRVEGLGKSAPRLTSVLRRPDIEEVVEIAQTGVILLDEFDKWMLRINHVTGEKDKAIQAELLKMIEGSTEYVNDSDEEIGVRFETSRVLIICAGAFVGLFAQVARRLNEVVDERTYLANENFWTQIEPSDFERFGLLPELAGRLATHIFTRPLTVEHLRRILVREEGLLDEYRARYEAFGVRWAVSEGAVIHLAEQASRVPTGARALEHVLWKVLGGEVLFDASTSDVEGLSLVYEVGMPHAKLVKAA